ncbi:MAG TPA: hypothetical protein VIC32_00580 [Terriglobales bacterium]
MIATFGPMQRLLLSGAIDYAGMFPPAQLPLERAAANYTRYAAGENRWALGRFVVPASAVDTLKRRGSTPPLAVVGSGIEDCGEDGAFVELNPAAPDFETMAQQVRAEGKRAKLRTGGVRAEAIPSLELVAYFLVTCARLGLGCKATAGLHHAVRGEYPLTYAADAPRAVMHGYLNVMLAAALLIDGSSPPAAEAVLALQSTDDLHFGENEIRWAGEHWSREMLVALRRQFTGFGSCSFDEPLQALAALA